MEAAKSAVARSVLSPRIAEAVRLSRMRKRFTQAALADASGVSLATIIQIENEGMLPSITTLAAIAAACKITLSSLLKRASL